MKNIAPAFPDTTVNQRTGEWVPKSFDGFLRELRRIETLFNSEDNLLVFRGHRKREWLLDSTFVRSCKSTLFGITDGSKFSRRFVDSMDLHLALLNLFLLKFGVLVRPSEELTSLEAQRGIDPWFELMKRIQQHPDELHDGHFRIKGTNLLDWTKSADVALYFANEDRNAEGAIFICDATATGNTQQIIPVGDILEKMNASGNGGNSLGVPLMFHPPRQILNQRAKNQQAIYFAQMDLRHDLEAVWRLCEEKVAGETILIKLVLPAGTECEVSEYLVGKGVNSEFTYPNE